MSIEDKPSLDEINNQESLKRNFDLVAGESQMLERLSIDRMENMRNLTVAESFAASLSGVSQEIGALSGLNAFTLLSDKLINWAEESVKQRDEEYQNKSNPFTQDL